MHRRTIGIGAQPVRMIRPGIDLHLQLRKGVGENIDLIGCYSEPITTIVRTTHDLHHLLPISRPVAGLSGKALTIAYTSDLKIAPACDACQFYNAKDAGKRASAGQVDDSR